MGNLARFVLTIGAAAFFAGCGGSQPPIGASLPSGRSEASSPSIPGSHFSITTHLIAHSWHLTPPKGTTGTLWATDQGYGTVDMIAYPSGTLIGQVAGFSKAFGICSDKSGNVYVAGASVLREINSWGHVVRSWPAPRQYTFGCSVAPNGDIAVSSEYAILVYPKAGPRYIRQAIPGGLLMGFGIAGYDSHSNLFVVCYSSLSQPHGALCGPTLAELPVGGKSWIFLSFVNGRPLQGAVQNMGRYLGISSTAIGYGTTARIELVKISGTTATNIKTITFGNYTSSFLSNWATISAKPNGVGNSGWKGFVFPETFNLHYHYVNYLEVFSKNGGSPIGSILALPNQADVGVTFTRP